MTKNELFEFDTTMRDGFIASFSPSPKFLQLENSQKNLPSNLKCEGHLVADNFAVIGTDEAGRGPGAGGVFASAVYFPQISDELIISLSDLNDSKKLRAKKRDELYDIIIKTSIHSTVCIEVEEIEKINILNSSLKAMKLACENILEQIKQQNILVLVDGNKLIKDFAQTNTKDKNHSIKQKYIIKGDSKSASIAAASILAKVTRDRYMQELDKKFPQYGWAKNAGYMTKEHLEAVDKYGLTKYHRKSFFKKHFEKQLTLFN